MISLLDKISKFKLFDKDLLNLKITIENLTNVIFFFKRNVENQLVILYCIKIVLEETIFK